MDLPFLLLTRGSLPALTCCPLAKNPYLHADLVGGIACRFNACKPFEIKEIDASNIVFTVQSLSSDYTSGHIRLTVISLLTPLGRRFEY